MTNGQALGVGRQLGSQTQTVTSPSGASINTFPAINKPGGYGGGGPFGNSYKQYSQGNSIFGGSGSKF